MSVLCPCCSVHPDDCRLTVGAPLAADPLPTAIPSTPFRIHHLKTWPAPFQAVLAGHKTHEVRKDDRGFEVGDVLYLVEYDPSPKPYPHGYEARASTGRELRVLVTYISRGVHGLPENMIVMSVRPEPVPGEASALIVGTPRFWR